MDVAQLFFNIDKINDSVNIIEWRRDRDISELKRSTNKGHKRLGDTLELFLEQDAKAFNFKYFDSLYLLCYNGKGKKTEMDIIGGTSPNDKLVESVEIPANKFFIGVQYHPEFKSRPNRANPIIKGFIEAAVSM